MCFGASWLPESLFVKPSIWQSQDVRAVAGPGNASQGSGFWPQLVMDVSYSGRISMTVSTKVRVQDEALHPCSLIWLASHSAQNGKFG
eukprot:1143207-Pelagomonas_calceolata.AAC.5